MRGLYIEAGRARYREDLDPPRRAAGQTRVRVLLAGVCATDLALVRGYMGFRGIPGHEFVGQALEGPLAGQRVVGEINAACGSCQACRGGRERHCPQRTVLGILNRPGAFAEELSLPAGNLLPVPESVPDQAAVFCEPLAAALEIAAQLDLASFRRALVVGNGRLGLLCAKVLCLHGLPTTLAGRHPERAALCPGVEHRTGMFEPEPDTAPDGTLHRAPARREYDLVVEASGQPSALRRCFDWVEPRGTIVLKTTGEKPYEIDLAPLVVDEVQLLGSRCGSFQPALEALAEGRLSVAGLVDGQLPLSEAERALEWAARPGTLKILIEP